MKPDVVLLDLNGTLLDLSALDPLFVGCFGDSSARERWFSQLQISWMTAVACGTYVPFDSLAAASLRMLGEREGARINDGCERKLLAALTELPPFPDVIPGLERLRAAGLRLAVLTNSTLATARTQVKSAGLSDYLDDVLSVEQVRRYKPSPEPYLYAARQVDAPPERILLAAAHAWDVAGAHAAGLQTAFIARPRQPLSPAFVRPDHHAPDLVTLARRLP